MPISLPFSHTLLLVACDTMTAIHLRYGTPSPYIAVGDNGVANVKYAPYRLITYGFKTPASPYVSMLHAMYERANFALLVVVVYVID